jgi:hypothetical protein
MVGKHHLMAFVFRDRCYEAFPLVREHFRDAELIVPVEFSLGQRVDAAHDEFGHALGMFFRIGQAPASSPRSRRTPAIDRHRPSRAAARYRQPDARWCWLPVPHAGWTCRNRAGRTACHVIELRIEQAAVVRRDRAAWAAMQEDGRLGARRSGFFPIDPMAIADIEMAGGIGFDSG